MRVRLTDDLAGGRECRPFPCTYYLRDRTKHEVDRRSAEIRADDVTCFVELATEALDELARSDRVVSRPLQLFAELPNASDGLQKGIGVDAGKLTDEIVEIEGDAGEPEPIVDT